MLTAEEAVFLCLKGNLYMNKENSDQKETTSTKQGYKFIIYRPGGNDTCLVEGNIPTDMRQRKKINDLIMKTYGNVEQVGFINLDFKSEELAMAGGEFCGNATRSTAWQALNGKPGEIEIKVSGVLGKLKAGVNSQREGFAQMPIYPDFSKISVENDNCFKVEMEGITHLIDFNSQIKDLSEEEIKKKAEKTIKEKGLNLYPAAGIIYVTEEEKGLRIDPVVYVRDINTLFYESACGSGTTALGMVLALQKGDSIINVPVFQPSGLPIKVSINYDGLRFGYAQIEGPIQKLNSGTIEMTERMEYVIEQITNTETLQKALTVDGLSKLYQEIFSQAPYFEKFNDEEVGKFFREYVRDGLLFLARYGKQVVGFGAALPLSSVPQISKLTGLDPNYTWYMADLGVREEYRRFGIARKLVENRINNIPKNNSIIMRTSVNNIPSQSLYLSLGFKKIEGIMQEVIQQRIDGSIQKDQRIFLTKP